MWVNGLNRTVLTPMKDNQNTTEGENLNLKKMQATES